MAIVGELEATSVPKHVRVDREWHLGSLADTLDEAVETDAHIHLLPKLDGPRRQKCKRGQQAISSLQNHGRKLGGKLLSAYVTTGHYDVVATLDMPNGEAMVKFASAISGSGNARTTTVRAYPLDEFSKLAGEAPTLWPDETPWKAALAYAGGGPPSRQMKEENMKRVIVTTLLGAFCVFLTSSAYAAEGHTFVTPSDFQWIDVPALPPGAKIAVIEGPLGEAVPFTFRIKLPADYKIPAHSHPAIEHVTVISGTFNVGMGDKLDPSKTQAIPAGGVAIMQPKMNHFAWTKEETILQVHGVGPWAVNYVNPADDPRKKS